MSQPWALFDKNTNHGEICHGYIQHSFQVYIHICIHELYLHPVWIWQTHVTFTKTLVPTIYECRHSCNSARWKILKRQCICVAKNRCSLDLYQYISFNPSYAGLMHRCRADSRFGPSQCYFITTSLIGWVQTWNQSCIWYPNIFTTHPAWTFYQIKFTEIMARVSNYNQGLSVGYNYFCPKYNDGSTSCLYSYGMGGSLYPALLHGCNHLSIP